MFTFCFTAIEQNDDSLQEEINKAHVICIVYSVEDDASLERISQHWLPLIRESVNESEQRKPVVLVGNKIDLIDYSTIDVRSKPYALFIYSFDTMLLNGRNIAYNSLFFVSNFDLECTWHHGRFPRSGKLCRSVSENIT